MASDIPTSPIIQNLDVLLAGTGFNFYKAENLARADDLLIRNQASGALGEALTALSALHSSYRLRFIPPPTREQPFPDRESSRKAEDILRLRDRIGQLSSGIRGMPVPTQDKIWRRFRKELTLLQQLLSADYLLISHCEGVRSTAENLTPEAWNVAGADGEVQQHLGALDAAIRERKQLLQMM